MKKCRKCGIEKDMNDYYVHSMMADGHLNICKDCTRKRITDYWYANAEKLRVMERERYQRRKEGRKQYYKKYAWKDGKSKKTAERLAMQSLKKNGGKPKKCSICGKEDILHMHHPDYLKPLDIVWCCVPCHRQIHTGRIAI